MLTAVAEPPPLGRTRPGGAVRAAHGHRPAADVGRRDRSFGAVLVRAAAGGARREGTAVAAHPHGEVVLHDLPDLRLRQELVGAKRVLDARGRIGRPGGDETQVLRRVGVVAQLTQAASELGGGAQRGHAVTADQPGDGRVIDTRLLGELALRHLLGLELGSKPFVERSAVLAGHAAWALLGACPRAVESRSFGASMPR